ncbi:MAG: PilZ domain-containing protein [Acidobacteria bacterium]|nr:PilZ domain-containing protein [Acidobacteriota bacterium]
MNATDKRRARRFPMQLPVSIRPENAKNGAQTVQTRDVSSSGIYFDFQSPMSVGTSVEFLMTLPEPLTKGSPVRIKCIGKVVRVAQNGNGSSSHVGIAATIERYEFVREN